MLKVVHILKLCIRSYRYITELFVCHVSRIYTEWFVFVNTS